MFGALSTVEGCAHDALADTAREFSPRLEVISATEIVLDLNGLTRLFGDARTIAEELRRTAADRGLRVRVAIAGTRTAARLLVRHRAGLTIAESGSEAAAVAPLPITLLADVIPALSPGIASSHSQVASQASLVADAIATFRKWGLRTLGELAALPPDDLSARIGRREMQWQRLARGEDIYPLVPAVPEERFEQSLDLEWPIEELEPLSFVLGRLMEQLEAHLERRDRGAAVLHVRLHLIKTDGTTPAVHERTLQLPVAIRDARTLRTLALLDLESNPPPAAIDRVTVAVDPTPGRIVQFSLLTRPLPSPEQISTLMARLQALMGEARCGAPATVDSWEPGAFAMTTFHPGAASRSPIDRDTGPGLTTALRRFRHPVPARVHVKDGKPSAVSITRRGLEGGAVSACAGPWRTSGGWWQSENADAVRAAGQPRAREAPGGSPPGSRVSTSWDRDEWDVSLATGPTYRLFRERASDRWFVDGQVD